MKNKGQYKIVVPDGEYYTCSVPDIHRVDPYEYPVISFYRNNICLGYIPTVVARAQRESKILLKTLQCSSELYNAELYKLPVQAPLISKALLFVCGGFFGTRPPNVTSTYPAMYAVERAKRILQPNITLSPCDFIPVTWCAQATMLIRRLNLPLEQLDKVAEDYEYRRLLYERAVFNDVMKPFTLPGNEKNLIQLLIYNGYNRDALFDECITDGDIVDTYVMLELKLYRPLVYFKAPVIEVPLKVAEKLPLRPGGYVHLHPVHVTEWLWCRTRLFWRRINNNVWESTDEAIQRSSLLTLAKRIYLSMQRRKTGYAEKRRLAEANDTPKVARYYNMSANMLPACMRLGRWFKNEERKQLIASMYHAEVDIEECMGILESYRRLEYPNESTSERRASLKVRSLWDPKYRAQGCFTHIKNAKKLRRADPVLMCPYKGNSDTECRSQCVAELKSHYSRPPQWATVANMKSPTAYIKLRNQAEEYAKKRPHIEIKMEEEEEEEEEDDDFFEEEEEEEEEMYGLEGRVY